jgi:hypothetical protein
MTKDKKMNKRKKNINFLESISVLLILKNSLTWSLTECNRKENQRVE